MNDLPNNVNEVSRYFNSTTLEICEGQALDKEFENDLSITEEMYMDMVEKKTGALLGASAVLPAIYNGEKTKTLESYEQYGRRLGIAFQIHDDLLEVTADKKTMGKSLGSDIAEGKQTIMAIKARKKFPDQWNKLIENPNKPDSFKNICMFFKETGIIEETRSIASFYFNSSLKYLKNLDGINTNELTQLVELIEKRTY